MFVCLSLCEYGLEKSCAHCLITTCGEYLPFRIWGCANRSDMGVETRINDLDNVILFLNYKLSLSPNILSSARLISSAAIKTDYHQLATYSGLLSLTLNTICNSKWTT